MAEDLYHHMTSIQIHMEAPSSDVFKDDFRLNPSDAASTTGQTLGPKEIRLVRIVETESNDPGKPICCTTRVVDVSEKIPYQAVSYTWGSPIATDKRYKIELDGHVRLLAKNLWRFLSHTRNMGRYGWFWIDALSITQDNARERNAQVQKMSEIFGDATSVVVWLGPRYESSEKAIQSLKQLKLGTTFGVPRAPPGKRFESQEEIYRLCERPYWKRLWVLQELTAAAKIILMCGNKNRYFSYLRWEHLQQLVYHYPNDKILQQTPAGRMVDLVKKGQAGTTVWVLMCRSRRLQCADPRDRAYAIPGRRLTTVDYTISVTVLAKRILRGLNGYSRYLPTLSDAIFRAQRAVSIFRLQPHALLEITEGLLDSSTTMNVFRPPYNPRPPAPKCIPITNYELPEDSPQFHILSRWAKSRDKRTVYNLLLQHMRGDLNTDSVRSFW